MEPSTTQSDSIENVKNAQGAGNETLDEEFFRSFERRLSSIKDETGKNISFWNISPSPDKKPWLTIDHIKYFQEQMAKNPGYFLTSEEIVRKIKLRFENEQHFKRSFAGMSVNVASILDEVKKEFIKAFDQLSQKIQEGITPKTQWETILTSFHEKKVLYEEDSKLLEFLEIIGSLLSQQEFRVAENRVQNALENIKNTVSQSRSSLIKCLAPIEAIDFSDFRLLKPLNEKVELGPPQKFVVEKVIENAVVSRSCWGTRGISLNDKKGLYLTLGAGGEAYLRRFRDDKLIRSGKFEIGSFFVQSTWSCVAWDPSENRFAIAGSPTRNIYVMTEKFEVEKYIELKCRGYIWEMKWWDDNHIVTGHEDGTIILYQVSTNGIVSSAKVCARSVVYLSPFLDRDGERKLGISSTEGEIFFYRITEEGVLEKTEEFLNVLRTKNWINHFSLSPSRDRMAVASYEKNICMLERDTNTILWVYNNNMGSESYLAQFSPNGSYILANEYCVHRPLFILDAAKGTLLYPIQSLFNQIYEPIYTFAIVWEEMLIIATNRAGIIARIRMVSE